MINMLLAQVTHEGTPLFEGTVSDSAVDRVLLVVLAYSAPVALVAVIAVVLVAVAHALLLAVRQRQGTSRADNTVEGGGDYVI